jgi:hypothetical protein
VGNRSLEGLVDTFETAASRRISRAELGEVGVEKQHPPEVPRFLPGGECLAVPASGDPDGGTDQPGQGALLHLG